MAMKIFETNREDKPASFTTTSPIVGLTNPSPLDTIVETEDEGVVGKDGVRRIFKNGAVTEIMPTEEYTQTVDTPTNDFEAVFIPTETEEVIEK